MGNSVDNGAANEDGDAMIPSGSTVSGALSSLWSTSSDKDDTCVQWGLVRYSAGRMHAFDLVGYSAVMLPTLSYKLAVSYPQ